MLLRIIFTKNKIVTLFPSRTHIAYTHGYITRFALTYFYEGPRVTIAYVEERIETRYSRLLIQLYTIIVYAEAVNKNVIQYRSKKRNYNIDCS